MQPFIAKIKALLFTFTLLIATVTFADPSFYNSELHNQSKLTGPNGYYLVRDKVWSEHGGCVLDSGNKTVNPGESTALKINKGCSTGGVGFKIFSAANHQSIGYLSYNFHDGSFSMKIKPKGGKIPANIFLIS